MGGCLVLFDSVNVLFGHLVLHWVWYVVLVASQGDIPDDEAPRLTAVLVAAVRGYLHLDNEILWLKWSVN